MKNELLTIGISTVVENEIKTLEKVKHLRTFCHVLVVVQGDKKKKELSVSKGDHVTIIYDSQKGLSRSRNHLLQHCQTRFLLVGDDDQEFLQDGIQSLYNYFLENHHLACVTGKILTTKGKAFKAYKKKSCLMSWRQILSISSIEMMLNVPKLNEKQQQFDERFGLGSKYIVGEEAILLLDLYKKKAFSRYLPIFIAKHHPISTAEIMTKKRVISRGATFFRMFNLWGILLLPLYTIKQHRNYQKQSNINGAVFLYWLFAGFVDFMMKEEGKPN